MVKTAIFITEEDAKILIKSLNVLVDEENDTKNYTHLYKMLSEVQK